MKICLQNYFMHEDCSIILLSHNDSYEMHIASRVSVCHLDTQTLKSHLSGHPNPFVSNFSNCQFWAPMKFLNPG